MELTADLGNSRLKLALWPSASGPPAEALALWEADSLEELWEGARAQLADPAGFEGRVSLAALSSVGDPDRTGRLAEALRRVAERVVVAPGSGLANTCLHPETVGLDRLYAARGALEEAPQGAVVIDAGTALTVDAVGPALDAADGRGRFLGGAIAPGPELGASALARSTAALPRVSPRPGDQALGRHTAQALQAGLVVGFRGAARELALAVAREAGLSEAPWFLTGGARAFLLEPTVALPAPRLFVRPALVHRGLLAAAREATA